MAISSIGSYPPTMAEFEAHWAEVNAALSPGALTLSGGYTLANFTTDRSSIETAITAVETADNSRQGASADRDIKKAGQRGRLAQFRATVSGVLPGTIYVRMLPTLPLFRAVESRFIRPLDDMSNIWDRINTDTIPGFTAPLLLSGGYALADFQSDLADLRAAYLAWTNAENGSLSARSSRNVLLPPARERMRQYRQAVKGALPPGHALLATVPALTPPPGSTPDPVNLSGVWNGTTLMADLSWTASPNPNLDHYSVRTAPGPTYHTADESVVAEVPAGTTTFSTNEGLVAPGATALFKVYVVLTTANEKGSNTVGVTRPG